MKNRFRKANFTSFSNDSDKIYEFSENSMKICDFHSQCVQNKLCPLAMVLINEKLIIKGFARASY